MFFPSSQHYCTANNSTRAKVRALLEFLTTYQAQGCRFELGFPAAHVYGFAVRGEALAADGERVAALSILLPENAPRLYAKQVADLTAAWEAADVDKV